jgi:hypothetical protein
MAREKTGSVCEFCDERGRLRYKVGITLPERPSSCRPAR